MDAVSALGPAVQIAYAVPDLIAAARRWTELHGAGPFFVRHHIALTDVVHRGRPAVFDHSSAYGQCGPIMIELVQDHTAGPSIVADLFEQGHSGLHHHAYLVDDVHVTIRRLLDAGYELAMSARTAGGTEFHFVDATATHGHLLELYQRSDRLERFYADLAAAAHGWTGADPIRYERSPGG